MPGRRALSGAIAVAAAACLLTVAPAASAFVYWADTGNQTVGRASNDGSGVNDAFIHTGELPSAVAVDAAHVYWVNQNSGSIGRANIDGSGVDNSFITGITKPDGIAVNATSIFWATIGGQIGKANIDGTSVKPSFVTGPIEPCGVALDSGHVYWADIATGTPAYIGRASLDGNTKQLEYVTIPGTSFPCGVAVNSSNIFWSEIGFLCCGTRIGRANTNTGGGADASLIGDAAAPCGVALDAAHLYWANSEAGTIGRANTDATGVNQSFIATGASAPCGVAVDALTPPPPAFPPAPTASTLPETRIGRGPGKKLAQGVARLSFSASVPGSSFECKLDAKKRAPCRSPKRYAHLAPGRHLFKVWAIDAAGRDPTPAKRAFRVPSSG
jgi:hypothetical protein